MVARAPLHVARASFATAYDKGTLYAIGGNTGSATNALASVEAFTPVKNLAVGVSFGSARVGRGAQQLITVQTLPHAKLTATVALPHRTPLREALAAGLNGEFIWNLTVPGGARSGKAEVRVTARLGRRTARASASFRLT